MLELTDFLHTVGQLGPNAIGIAVVWYLIRVERKLAQIETVIDLLADRLGISKDPAYVAIRKRKDTL